MGRPARLVCGSLILAVCCAGAGVWAAPEQTGLASWYSLQDRGVRRKTASGELFDHTKATCASWHYAMGTHLQVTNQENGKSVVCRVNDRGPARRFTRRVIDLSRSSFNSIASLKKGLVRVKIRPSKKK